MQAEVAIIIPAAGAGVRFGTNLPKQYAKIEDHTVLDYSVLPLLQVLKKAEVVVAVHRADVLFDTVALAHNPLCTRVQGGDTRAESVLSALQSMQSSPPKWVLVHDAARPCVSKSDVEKLYHSALNHPVGALLVSPVVETLKMCDDGLVIQTLNREHVYRALTPQMFQYDILYHAYKLALFHDKRPTDDSSAIELLGLKPMMVEGDASNIKVTYQSDLLFAKRWLTERSISFEQHKERAPC